jgi:hypothetical protein
MRLHKPALMWALLYLAVGGATKAIAYLITGVAQFPVDWEEARSLGTLISDVLGFLVFRSGIALLVGISLAWCLSATATRRFTVFVVLLPLLCELILLRHLVTVWPGLGIDGVIVAAAYLATPLVSGLLLVFVAMRVAKDAEPTMA